MVIANTLRPGDFHGLVNLSHLNVEAKHILTGTFTGLDNLNWMDLTAEHIEPGAFKGLDNLTYLKFQPQHQDSIKSLPSILKDLPSLEKFQINRTQTTSEEPLEGKPWEMPDRLFEKNKKLTHINMSTHPHGPIQVPKNLFAENAPIIEFELNTPSGTATIHQEAFKQLTKLNELHLPYRTKTPGNKSKKTPNHPLRIITPLPHYHPELQRALKDLCL